MGIVNEYALPICGFSKIKILAWEDDSIELTNICLSQFQEDDGAFLNKRIDDKGCPDDDEYGAEGEAKVALSPAFISVRVLVEE